MCSTTCLLCYVFARLKENRPKMKMTEKNEKCWKSEDMHTFVYNCTTTIESQTQTFNTWWRWNGKHCNIVIAHVADMLDIAFVFDVHTLAAHCANYTYDISPQRIMSQTAGRSEIRFFSVWIVQFSSLETIKFMIWNVTAVRCGCSTTQTQRQ